MKICFLAIAKKSTFRLQLNALIQHVQAEKPEIALTLREEQSTGSMGPADSGFAARHGTHVPSIMA